MEDFIPIPQQHNVIPVEPAAQVYICAGIPWDSDYNHVRLFNSKDELHSYVTGKAILPVINLSSPVLFGELYYSVEANQSQLLRANYMAFKNAPYTDEWVYAFITNVEWLSANSAKIIFQLDVWQNNIYNLEIEECFVERQHVPKSEDVIGGNLLPENIETGEFISPNAQKLSYGDLQICIMTSADPSGQAWEGQLINNVYTPCNIQAFDTAEAANTWVKTYQDRQDAIINAFMAPGICVDQDNQTAELSVPMPTQIDGYTPKNNKAFSYPWVFAVATNLSGKSSEYYFEYSSEEDHSLSFAARGVMATQPAVYVTPKNYKGRYSNFEEGFVQSNFPPVAWTYDGFQAWLAQNYAPLVMQAKSAVLTAAGATLAIAAGPVGAAAGVAGATGAAAGGLTAIQGLTATATAAQGLMGVENVIAQVMSHATIPDTVRGQAQSECALAALSLLGTWVYTKTVKREFIEVADSFWTVYGYPIRKVQKPNLRARSAFTYIKTVGCGFHGSAVMDDIHRIQSILDRGVWVWRTNDIGNFSQDNT